MKRKKSTPNFSGNAPIAVPHRGVALSHGGYYLMAMRLAHVLNAAGLLYYT